MSMPSSSDAVATSARSSPALSRCSASSRRSRDRLPWWLVTGSSPEDASASRARDPLGQLARVDEDERRAVLADQLGHPRVDLVPLLVRADGRERRAAAPRPRGRARGGGRRRRARTRARRRRGSAPTSSSGFCVAESPMRWTGGRTSASSRSSESARWVPRLSRARAWISSTITVRTVRSMAAAAVAREQDVERLGRGDQDVRRLAAHRGARRAAGVSPVRTSTRTSGSERVERRGSRRAALAGSSGRRCRAPAAARRRAPASRPAGPGPGAAAPSIADRNAASVLPVPVGAAISVCRPVADARPALALRPRRLAEARLANQRWTAGWNGCEREHAWMVPAGTGQSGPRSRRSSTQIGGATLAISAASCKPPGDRGTVSVRRAWIAL